MDWESIFDLPAAVTPQEAHKLGVMVAAMVKASLAKVVEDSVEVNLDSFRSGLQAGLAETGLDLASLLLTQPTLVGGEDGQASFPRNGEYIVPVPWDTQIH